MKKLVSIVCSLFMVCMLSAQESMQNLVRDLKDPNLTKVFVVSHRGDWRNAPENSLQAFQNCIDMGVDMVELDLKKTKDGQLILMHDRTINRTTNGKGKPSRYTLAALRKFHLKNGLGRVTFHQIPTLEEALNLCKGKIMINIDKGYDYFKDVYRLLVKTGTVDQVVIKSGYPLKKVEKENGDVLSKVIYMPVVNLDDPGAAEMIKEYSRIKPVAMECCFTKATPEVLALLKEVKESGSKIWINSLWPELNGGYDDDRAVDLKQPDEAWGWLLEQGASLIQTDRPAALIDYLRSKGRH